MSFATRCRRSVFALREEAKRGRFAYVPCRQPIFNATLGAAASWLFLRVARRLRIDLDMRPSRALPAAHFERNDVTIIRETVH